MPKVPDWRGQVHPVALEWCGPIDYPDLIEERLRPEHHSFLDEYVGIYFWRAKSGVFARTNLYVGQTWQGLLQRSKQHLKGDLGEKLRMLHEQGKLAYVWCAAVAVYPERKRLPEGFPEVLFDTLERVFICHFTPLWNVQCRVEAVLPLTLEITNTGSLPPEVRSRMRFEAGKYVLMP